MKRLLMGNEAVALGAVRAGVEVVTGYPGTPSTEILETVVRERGAAGIYAEWSVNEKTALEVAAGAAISGRRAMVTMKQVGLNVASDPLMSLNYLGVRGGLVLAVADDPGPISSQTEQDTRRFGQYAKVAVFDPSSPGEAYTMIADAFEYSEKYGRPVIFRPTTRVCHSYGSVEILPPLRGRGAEGPGSENSAGSGGTTGAGKPGFEKGNGRWVIFPALTYKNHIQIEADLVRMASDFSGYRGNRLCVSGYGSNTAAGNNTAADGSAAGSNAAGDSKAAGASRPVLGIAAGGVSCAYAEETLRSLAGPFKYLKIATVPLPLELALEFLDGLEEALVLEELDPVIEKELVYLAGLHHLPVKVRGKLGGDTPNAGENKPGDIENALKSFLGRNHVREGGACYREGGPQNAASLSAPPALQPPRGFAPAGASATPQAGTAAPPLPVRPPVLCAGCPHRGSFFAVKEAVRLFAGGRKAVYSGDIGCYTLGNAQPLDMTDTCLCMGAGVSMAQGISRAEPGALNFAFIGDSTFFHSGIPGVVNAVYNGADIIVVILDNGTTAMTGSQPHPGTGVTAGGASFNRISIEAVLGALGVKHIAKASPFGVQAAKEAVASVFGRTGVRAVIFEGPCVMPGRAAAGRAGPLVVDDSKCTRCKLCVTRLGCPAISLSAGGVRVDPVTCTGCLVCASVCPSHAIAGAAAPEGKQYDA
ncbi:MAG: 4Fe-4S binding protein [Spirochaetaceae bacterium]|jgi:indolepyruvate ferredoxin oxidoreductase alpha subunit|nr:4Fe-4S binding protein [Spirochaetaceae bacterium]